MKRLQTLFDTVIRDAIAVLKTKGIPLHTFAFYHDHESAAVSVCADTEANSRRVVLQMNRYRIGHFIEAIERRDVKHAALWQANVGRSLSLGDFALVNLARKDLGRLRVGTTFHLVMVRTLLGYANEIAQLSPDPDTLLFCCSGPDNEIAYVWSALPA
jgi:hypothetical protein